MFFLSFRGLTALTQDPGDAHHQLSGETASSLRGAFGTPAAGKEHPAPLPYSMALARLPRALLESPSLRGFKECVEVACGDMV